MNCLVTVGTTCFDSLIMATQAIGFKNNKDHFTFQIADGNFVPSLGVCLKYSFSIDSLYCKSDCIITHAGAGTIFKLLEINKNIIIVPNLERVDKHQSDIAKYMEDNNHALVCWDLDELEYLYAKSKNFVPTKFVKEKFFKFNEVSELIASL